MSRIAAILMFVAWLLYGAMPVIGMPAMLPEAGQQSQLSMPDHSPPDHDKTMEMAETTHAHGAAQPPCPHGGKICVTPFCAACLTLLPEIALGDESRFRHGYQATGIEQALLSSATAPLTPPPRG